MSRAESGPRKWIARAWSESGPRSAGTSIRLELLAGLAVLLVVALLALTIATIIWIPLAVSPWRALLGLGLLVVVDVAALLLFGDYLLRHLFVRPVERVVRGVERIVGGDHGYRLPEEGAREARRLAASVNRLADRLLRNQEELEENIRSLEETNRALVEAKNELVRAEKLATVGRMAAGIAHEVGNPLSSILHYVEIARRRGAEGQEWVEGIAHEAERIDAIVRGLLEYARPEGGERRSLEPNDVVERSVELLERQGRLEGMTVERDLAPTLPRVLGDPRHLQQVMVNLLLNAVDALEEDGEGEGIRISTTTRLHREPVRPDSRRSRRADDPSGTDYSHLRRFRRPTSEVPRPLFEPGQRIVEVRVADDGPGLAPEDVPRVFDPFFTTKEPGRGTGLGLAVSARLVGGMGGTIEAENGEEGGAVFRVVLPAAGEGEVRAEEDEREVG